MKHFFFAAIAKYDVQFCFASFLNKMDVWTSVSEILATNRSSYFSTVFWMTCAFVGALYVPYWSKKKVILQPSCQWKQSLDNTVYLTRCHFQSWYSLVFVSIVYGMMTYFSHVINLICLFICLGQIYEYNDYRSVPSLSIFACLHAIMETYEQHSKFNLQTSLNKKKINKILTPDVHAEKILIPQCDLRRGDYILLSANCNATVPADVLLVRGQVYVNELQLTGEKTIVCKSRQIDHQIDKDEVPNPSHVVFRGTEIVDRTAVGLVIRTGNDCEMYRTSQSVKKPPSGIQKKITLVSICNLYLLLLLSTIGALTVYYYENQTLSFWKYLKQLLLLLNTIIPLSLYFCYHSASWILAKRLERELKISIRPHGMCTFQNQINSVASDKTNTITLGNTILNQVAFQYEGKDFCLQPSLIEQDPNLAKEIAFRMLSATDLAIHSQTSQVLCSNDLEWTMLNYFMQQGRIILHDNMPSSGGLLDYSYDNQTQERYTANRLLYAPYDPKMEVKYCVLQTENIGKASQTFTICVQGTPEGIVGLARDQKAAKMLLESLEEDKSPHPNAYHRIIGYGSKEVDSLYGKKFDQKTSLNLSELSGLENITFYDFLDELVPEVSLDISQLVSQKIPFSLLTGDKLQSAMEVGQKVGLISSGAYIHLETLQDLLELGPGPFWKTALAPVSGPEWTCLINGRLLTNFIEHKKELKIICEQYKIRIVYRATPHAKQLFIRFLQQEMQEVVLFVGDGLNDVVGALESATGVAVSNACGQLLATADLTVPNWHSIPNLLKEFQPKQGMIHNITGWILMKHFQTAAHLLTLFLMSEFQVIKDPASPYLMNLFNAILFLVMCFYCWKEASSLSSLLSFVTLILKGFILGIVNASIVFYFLDGDQGIRLLLGIQILQLVCQLGRFGEKSLLRMFVLLGLTVLYIAIQAPLPVSFFLCSITLVVFIE